MGKDLREPLDQPERSLLEANYPIPRWFVARPETSDRRERRDESVLRACLVCRVWMELLECPVSEETRETPEMPDREENAERTGCPAPTERKDHSEREVMLVSLVSPAARERRESPVTMEDKERKETVDPRVPSERARENPDLVESLDSMECPDPRDSVARTACLVPSGTEDRLDLPATPAPMDSPDCLESVRREIEDRMVFLVSLDCPESLERMETVDTKESPAGRERTSLDLLEQREFPVETEDPDCPELSEIPATQERRECLDRHKCPWDLLDCPEDPENPDPMDDSVSTDSLVLLDPWDPEEMTVDSVPMECPAKLETSETLDLTVTPVLPDPMENRERVETAENPANPESPASMECLVCLDFLDFPALPDSRESKERLLVRWNRPMDYPE